MAPKDTMGDRLTQIRRKAEMKIRKIPALLKAGTDEDLKALAHELSVHQVELEMQNEELRNAQITLEESRLKYMALYDFAPIGYITMGRNGLILESNLTAANILGIERGYLLKRRFSTFLAPDYRPRFEEHARHVFGSGEKQSCEVLIMKSNGELTNVQLESIPAIDYPGHTRLMQTAILDIQGKKIAEQKQAESSLALSNTNQLLMKEVAHSRELSERLVEIQETERRRIAIDLHDQAGFALSSLQKQFHELLETEDTVPLPIHRRLQEVQAAVFQHLHKIKDLSYQLWPSSIEHLGLIAGIRQLIDEINKIATIRISFYHGDIPEDIPIFKALTFYRIVQEALTNILKHARTSEIFIHLYKKKDAILLSIEDKGAGFDLTKQATDFSKTLLSGMGIRGMRERTIQSGGTFTIESQPGKGTLITVEIPI